MKAARDNLYDDMLTNAEQNINAPHGGGFNDFQDSFFFAEVLKYAFAIHMPVSFLDGRGEKSTADMLSGRRLASGLKREQ